MASSSSSSINRWNYDVFLSFRGADTRNTFTGHLYRALYDKGIYVFIDNELQRGEVITSQLLRVIEGSRISIVVLSEKYASSSFCLDEMVKIIECRESKGQIVLPVFYHVDPTDVEEQIGTFGEELAKLEAQFNIPNLSTRPLKKRRINNEEATTTIDRVRKWRLALTEVARLSGWHLEKGNHEATTIQTIVKMVLKKLDHTPLHVAEYPVGLDSRVDHILEELNLETNGVRMLGLHGMGGIGKTTSAKALYNRCVNQFVFDGSSFLLNVRENSKKYDLAQLQETLLCEILGDQKHLLGNFEKGIELIKQRLGGKKVLIVIDDVDDPEQLKKLAGELEWFGAGSRIIITTRDSRLLEGHGVTMIHEIKGLEHEKAKELFSWHAFKEPQPSEAYMELSRRAIKYAQGLPLALKVLGSSLYKRSIRQWDNMLKKLERYTDNKIKNDITGVLKVSYSGLDIDEKSMFLDIACFLRGEKKDEIIKFLDACGFVAAEYGVQRLIENSLVYEHGAILEMHDLLQEMGTQIGHEESSRLCIRKPEDIRAFLENKGRYDIEGILLDFPEEEEEEVPLDLLEELTNLRILIIRNGCLTRMSKGLPNSIRWLKWINYSLKSIPLGFLPANLFVLEMHWSRIVHLEKAFVVKSKAKKFMNLTRLNFSHCAYLREIVDFSAMPNLEELDLKWCKKLKKIDKSIRSLKKLEFMLFEGCRSLVSLPNLVGNERLKGLDLCGCLKLEKLPYLPTTLKALQLSRTGIKEIPSYIGNLTNLKFFEAENCENLVSISKSILKLPRLDTLHMVDCSKLTKFPDAESPMISSSLFPNLRHLNLWGSNFVTLPICISRFSRLEYFFLQDCKWLVEIPELPRSVVRLDARNCKSLERCSYFHYNFVRDFTNCDKLGENEVQSWRRVIFENLSLRRIEEYRRSSIILPGNEIPQWFNYAVDIEDDASSFCFKVPPPVINDNFIGVACCAIFQRNPELENSSPFALKLFINGDWVESIPCERPESEHMWLCYLSDYLCYWPEEISWEFNWRFRGDEIIVYKRVGVHFMYRNQR